MTVEEFNNSVVNSINKLKNNALYFTRNVDDAKDLMQDTVCRALVSRNNFAEYTNLNAWMYTIMRNLFINNFRYKKQRANVGELSEYRAAKIPGLSAKNDGISNIDLEYLNRELDQLPIEYREPFRLYYSGYKYTEIADKLNQPIGTIKSRIFLARKEMKKKLDVSFRIAG